MQIIDFLERIFASGVKQRNGRIFFDNGIPNLVKKN
jgi:hypothetical protein